MAFTQTELDTLNAAIAQGALTVKYGDKEVTYQSLDKMLLIRNLMIAEIKGPSVCNTGRKFASFSKGLL